MKWEAGVKKERKMREGEEGRQEKENSRD